MSGNGYPSLCRCTTVVGAVNHVNAVAEYQAAVASYSDSKASLDTATAEYTELLSSTATRDWTQQRFRMLSTRLPHSSI